MILLGAESWVSVPMKRWLYRQLQRVNHGAVAHDPVSAGVTECLRSMYAEDRLILEALLGRDLTPFWGPCVRIPAPVPASAQTSSGLK